MIEFSTTYLEPILAFITGGGLLSFATLKFTRKQAEANAMKAIQEVYSETIKSLREDKNYLNQEIAALREEVGEIRKKQNEIYRLKCTKLDCSQRQRK